MMGYLHPSYADSLREYGTPRELPRSSGWILERQIPGFPYHDAIGCYPLFSCCEWSRLHEDIDVLGGELVSLAVVTDPFGDFQTNELRRCFPDKMFLYKEHFVVDLVKSWQSEVSSHHRRNVVRSLREVAVQLCDPLTPALPDWIRLYDILIRRHEITGISAFSNKSFERLFQVPGLVGLRAVRNSETVGMILWILQGETAYYHLGAYNDEGYRSGASFALFWSALEFFASQGFRWVNLGAGAGIKEEPGDGLARFKQGWANTTRPVYFCGKIFDHKTYIELATARGVLASEYFPLYRAGEFAATIRRAVGTA